MSIWFSLVLEAKLVLYLTLGTPVLNWRLALTSSKMNCDYVFKANEVDPFLQQKLSLAPGSVWQRCWDFCSLLQSHKWSLERSILVTSDLWLLSFLMNCNETADMISLISREPLFTVRWVWCPFGPFIRYPMEHLHQKPVHMLLYHSLHSFILLLVQGLY